MSLRGTCACCFRDFAATSRGIATRHGWQEVGGRRVGQYGHAWHNGSCMGTQYPPYELSAEGTIALRDTHQAGVAHCQRALERLATLPMLEVTHSYRVYGREKCDVLYSLRLHPGDEFKIVPDSTEPWTHHDWTYDRTHSQHMQEVTRYRDAHLSMVDFCNEKIAAWTLQPLRQEEAVQPTVHYRKPGLNSRNKPFPIWCGSTSYGVRESDDPAAVSCARCLKALAADAAEDAKRAATAENLKRVLAVLVVGPRTSKQLKAELGLDQKQLNAALELDDRKSFDEQQVLQSNHRPTQYSHRKAALA